MRTRTTIALAAVFAAAPAAAYISTVPPEDPIGDVLKNYGYLPINPPSNLMTVGSIYYVDSNLKGFFAICDADKSDLDSVHTSSSLELQQSLQQNGQLATGISIDLGWLLKGKTDENYVVTVKTSLTDVTLDEIPLGPNWLIFAKLMNKPYCNRMAMQYIHAGGYVCQGTKILHATSEFKLDRDAQAKLETDAAATPEGIKDIVKQAVEIQGKQAVIDKEGRLLAGKSLEYGVTLTPICLAPPNARFQRVLPHSALDRVLNYVLFNIVEPMLPARPDRLDVAQGATDAEQLK
jgi:hypothetical protein